MFRPVFEVPPFLKTSPQASAVGRAASSVPNLLAITIASTAAAAVVKVEEHYS